MLPRDQWLLIGAAVGGYTVVHPILERAVFWPLARRMIKASSKVEDSEKERRSLHMKQWKFVVSMWKCVSYLFLVAYGAFALWDQQEWLWNPLRHLEPYENGEIPPLIINYYALQLGYYLYSTVTIFFEPMMKDRWQMLVHHLFTATLEFTSLTNGGTKFGMAIAMLHDVSDPLMEMAKMFLYCGYRRAADISFVAFALSYFYLRDYLFPTQIIWAVYQTMPKYNYPLPKITLGCLIGLWCLHIFWSILILKVIKNSLIDRSDKGDVREMDSDDE